MAKKYSTAAMQSALNPKTGVNAPPLIRGTQNPSGAAPTGKIRTRGMK